MRRTIHKLPAVVLAPAVFALALVAVARPGPAAPGMSRAKAILAGRVFAVDVAESQAQQRLGLGGRRRLKPDEGMLFLYADKSRRTFWMKGMLISIDILWLDNNRIVHIEHRVPPPAPGTPLAALRIYGPSVSANGVLEIAAGRAAQLGLRVGGFVRLEFK